MSRVLVVYYSRTGHTRTLAQAMARANGWDLTIVHGGQRVIDQMAALVGGAPLLTLAVSESDVEHERFEARLGAFTNAIERAIEWRRETPVHLELVRH